MPKRRVASARGVASTGNAAHMAPAALLAPAATTPGECRNNLLDQSSEWCYNMAYAVLFICLLLQMGVVANFYYSVWIEDARSYNANGGWAEPPLAFPHSCDFPEVSTYSAAIGATEPTLILNATQGWPALESWRKDVFMGLYGDMRAEFPSTAAMVALWGVIRPSKWRVRDVLENLGPDRLLFSDTIMRENPQLFQDYRLGDPVDGEAGGRGRDGDILSIGSDGAGLPFHVHGPTVVAVVFGMKR